MRHLNNDIKSEANIPNAANVVQKSLGTDQRQELIDQLIINSLRCLSTVVVVGGLELTLTPGESTWHVHVIFEQILRLK
jgi:hypothetical protein